MIPDYRVGPPAADAPGQPYDSDDDEPDSLSDASGAEPGAAAAQVYETRGCVVAASFHGQRIDKLLVEMAPEFSRNHLQGLLEQGHVRLDDAPAVSSSRKLRAGQRVELTLVPTAESRAFRAEALPLRIVHEDADLLVIDKAAGMVVHPAAGNWSGTLLNGLLAHHAGAASLPRAGIVHRLDKDTSGLMVVGKTLEAVTALSRAIAARTVRREYLALVHGVVPAGEWRIDAPIARDPKSRVRMAVVASGRVAQTDVTRVASDGVCSAVRCRLHTGRTHQIRVHLASRGHPLVADALYGGAARWGLQRQALHAARLGFSHPKSGRQMLFDVPLADDLAPAWQALLDAAADA
ncbi:RluA family pseudouridine synthase [Piscinibacter sakaiensis]|uniref:RluA family pseudouridine synthase n=1 Tax=Piscinibacter sakaiensis TaxID=1547922 RepID=UPI003AAFAFB0